MALGQLVCLSILTNKMNVNTLNKLFCHLKDLLAIYCSCYYYGQIQE